MAFYIFQIFLSASTHFACWRGVGCSKNPIDARDKNIQQRAKSLSLAGALAVLTQATARLKRPNMRDREIKLRSPTPILMKFGTEVAFGPKPTPGTIFLNFDPKNGVILGSEGSKILGFFKPFFRRKRSQGN